MRAAPHITVGALVSVLGACAAARSEPPLAVAAPPISSATVTPPVSLPPPPKKVASLAAIAKSAQRFARGLERKDDAEAAFLEAHELDAPNGLALIGAAFARMRRAHGKADAASRDLFARGVAELEEETTTAAHAGIARPVDCGGEFSNHLAVEWVGNRYVRVRCMASIFVDVVTGERVALTGDADVDERRLPRLRFLRADEPRAAEPLRACAFAPSASVRVDEPRGEVVLARSGAPDARHSIKKLFASLTKTALRDVRVECVPGTGPLAVVRATWDGGRALPIESVIAIDVDAQKVIGVAEGEPAHALDDGRLVVRAEHALTVFGAGGRKTEKHVLDGADLSPDGTRLVYVKERAVDEMYRPVFPYVRVLGQQEIPLDAPGDAATPHPASFVWPRVGPLAVTRCANSPVLPAEHEYCENPSFTLAGRTYDATDEAACAFAPRAHGAPFQIACLDPRGPVHVDEPWDRSFVCRIGPHRLPLAVCARLLK